MPVAKAPTPQRPAATRKPRRALAAEREPAKGRPWRESLQDLVSMIERQDFAALRQFCSQLTNSPDVVMALHGILLVARDGDVHNWDGIPEELINLTAVVADHLEAMGEAIDLDGICDPDIEPGAWIQVSLAKEGQTRITVGWYDIEVDPAVAEFATYRVIDFDAGEAVLAFLLVSEMADFAVYTGYEAALN